MLEMCRRRWPVFFSLFGVFVIGDIQVIIFAPEYKYQCVVIAIVSGLAVVCLTITIIGIAVEIKGNRRKDRESKAKEGWPILQ